MLDTAGVKRNTFDVLVVQMEKCARSLLSKLFQALISLKVKMKEFHSVLYHEY